MIIFSELLKNNGITGYDLRQSIPNVDHQIIYRQLTKLYELEYVTFRYEPQEGRPDKKIYNVPNANNYRYFFNKAVQDMPIDTMATSNTFEGMYRAVNYADPQLVIRWCDKLLKKYEALFVKMEALNMRADIAIRGVQIDFVKLIKKLATIRQNRIKSTENRIINDEFSKR